MCTRDLILKRFFWEIINDDYPFDNDLSILWLMTVVLLLLYVIFLIFICLFLKWYNFFAVCPLFLLDFKYFYTYWHVLSNVSLWSFNNIYFLYFNFQFPLSFMSCLTGVSFTTKLVKLRIGLFIPLVFCIADYTYMIVSCI